MHNLILTAPLKATNLCLHEDISVSFRKTRFSVIEAVEADFCVVLLLSFHCHLLTLLVCFC